MHIELRATWMQGENLEQFYSGEGVPYDNLASYVPPEKSELRQFRSRTDFFFSLIPSGLMRRLWNRLSGLATSNDAYHNLADLRSTFFLILAEVQRILERIQPTAFWDKMSPKSEPDAGWALRALFEALCPIKNLKVYQEDPSRSGQVDFVFSGISQDHTHLELVMELKHAHSPRLKQGLTVQLSTYRANRGSDLAMYGVLWYKGRGFDKPAHPSLSECLRELDGLRPTVVSAVCGFDVSRRTPASKVKRGVANRPRKRIREKRKWKATSLKGTPMLIRERTASSTEPVRASTGTMTETNP